MRQWITYDGNATLFIGERQLYLVLGKAPIRSVYVIPERSPASWMNQLIQDWKISRDELPLLIGQLNLGQSVETINRDGLPIRLWVNPKEKSKGVEPLVQQPIPPGQKRDYRKIAGAHLEQIFGSELEPRAMDELACSVAKQWQQYQGHACLFFREDRQVSLTLTEQANGSCKVAVARERSGLESLLSSLKVPNEIIPNMIARINLGQEVEFQDRDGVRSVLGYNPKAKRVTVRPLPLRTPVKPSDVQPLCCPKCAAKG